MISIAVFAGDRITGDGAVCYLRGQRGLTVLPDGAEAQADVVLILTTEVTEETMALMERAAARSVRPGMGIVLVTAGLQQAQLARAMRSGLRGVVWRQDSGYDKVVQAVRNVAAGDALLPARVQGWLVDHVGVVERDVLRPRGLTPSGLDHREVDVLRLLADGFDTTEIAQKLNYSERTIKSVVSAILNRLGLRNRAHAVAFALRSGTLP
ncbi:helix-turn-helix transcriptional regulator [Streptomyces panaciradicis]|uniref:helix-turn-helix transcriptional regulator n=1 Tax=Streptomyces panaciradicis TaxID=1470261 RepID=UPI00201CE75E|nr:LuxR C-terminal-related transcriptional regulator [Streptomyces panaciradicis]MCL6674135.1 LuxR C-terminal-related transcriptional regulator [Streptomyces panaciradicis]